MMGVAAKAWRFSVISANLALLQHPYGSVLSNKKVLEVATLYGATEEVDLMVAPLWLYALLLRHDFTLHWTRGI